MSFPGTSAREFNVKRKGAPPAGSPFPPPPEPVAEAAPQPVEREEFPNFFPTKIGRIDKIARY